MLKILFKPYVILPLAVILAAAAGLFYFRSAEIGNDIGTGAGKAAGLAVGSYKGITEGYASGSDSREPDEAGDADDPGNR